jgi:lysozyme
MDLNKLREQLEIDEGCVYEVYLDTKALPTCGIGHLITDKDIEGSHCRTVYPFLYEDISIEEKMIKFRRCDYKIKISKERVAYFFNKDIQSVIKDCNAVFSDFESFDEEIKQIVANMMFNLGINRFRRFKKMIAAIKENNFKEAARQMIDSQWYIEVGNRSRRLVKRMEDYANDYLCTGLKSIV